MTVRRAQMKYGFALIVIVFMAALTFVYPAHMRVKSAEDEINRLHAQLATADTTLKLIAEQQKSLDQLRERRVRETKLIPDHADLPGLIKAITYDISTLPLEGSNVNRSRDVKIDNDRSLGLVIETSGSFEGVFELVRRIEQLPRLVRINELNVRIDKIAPQGGKVEASIDISAFYRPTTPDSP